MPVPLRARRVTHVWCLWFPCHRMQPVEAFHSDVAPTLARQASQSIGSQSFRVFANTLRVMMRVQALVDGRVLCVHGGLSPDLRTLDQVSLLQALPVQTLPHNIHCLRLNSSAPISV